MRRLASGHMVANVMRRAEFAAANLGERVPYLRFEPDAGPVSTDADIAHHECAAAAGEGRGGGVAMVAPSSRHGETRFFAIGYIGSSLHALVFTKSGATVRVISLRRAHKTEVKRYEEKA